MTSKRWGARELVDLVLDEGTFESWDTPLDLSGHPEAYQAELRAAAEKAGTDESVVTGFGVVRGRPVAFVINEFNDIFGIQLHILVVHIFAHIPNLTLKYFFMFFSGFGVFPSAGIQKRLQNISCRQLIDHFFALGTAYIRL